MSAAFEGAERVAAWQPVAAVRGITAPRAVWAATVVAAVGWSAVAVARESLFLDGRYNLGNFTQAVWATAHGHFLRVTEVGGTEVSRLGIHVDPIIAAFAPLWWLWPSPNLLIVLHSVALALGAIPLFWLGRKHLPRERDAALFSIAYLLSPTIAWNAAISFTAVAFAVPLLLFAIWYLDQGRLWAFGATAGAAMLCQEQIGLIVGCLGLWYAWRQRRLAVGLVIAAAGFAVSAVDFLVVLKHFSGGSPYAARYGGSATGIAHDLFTNPLVIVHNLDPFDLAGLLLAVPVLGFCFGSTIILAAAPQIVILLLSRRSADLNPFGGNVLALIPFIYAATLFTLARAARGKAHDQPHINAGQVLVASLAMAAVLGPFGWSAKGLFDSHAVSAQRSALHFVPAGAPVSVTNHLAPPLAGRRYLYIFPVLKHADWAVVDSQDDWLPEMSFVARSGINFSVNDLYPQPRLMRREVQFLRRSPNWRLVYLRDHIYVFRRRSS